MTKYQQVFQDMMRLNQQKFDAFREIHDKFATEPDLWREEFNTQGRVIQDIVRRYENILCGKSQSTGYSKFATNLADKFQQEVRNVFPKIDAIGIK